MDCPKCGHKNKTGATACSSCYFELDSNKKPVNAPAQKPASPRKASPLPTQAQPLPTQAPQPQYAAQTQVQAPPQPGTNAAGGYPPPGGPGGQPPSGPAAYQGPAAFSGIPYFNYASFWTRFAATFVDGLVLLVVAVILMFATGVGQVLLNIGSVAAAGPTATSAAMAKMADSMRMTNAIDTLVQLLYCVGMVAAFGATLGRMALGIKVVREDGSPVGLGVALGRYIVESILSMVTCGLHYLAVAFSDTKQGWHDKLFKTIVIHTR